MRRRSLEREVVDLYLKYTIGASGAPTAVSGHTKGAASLAVTSPGVYVLTLTDAYRALLDFSVKVLRSTLDATNLQASLLAEAVATVGTQTVSFTMTKATSGSPNVFPMVAADPTSGDVLLIHLALSNTDIP